MDDGSPRRSRALLVVILVTALALGAAVVFTVLGVVATSKANETRDQTDHFRERRRALVADQQDIQQRRRHLAGLHLDAQVDINELSGASGYFRQAHDNAAIAEYAATLLIVLDPVEGMAGFATEMPRHVDELARRRDALRPAIDEADATTAATAKALDR